MNAQYSEYQFFIFFSNISSEPLILLSFQKDNFFGSLLRMRRKQQKTTVLEGELYTYFPSF